MVLVFRTVGVLRHVMNHQASSHCEFAAGITQVLLGDAEVTLTHPLAFSPEPLLECWSHCLCFL